MSDTALTGQAYETQHPWVDLSGYLVAGLQPRATGAVAAQIDGNTIHYAVWLLVTPEYQQPTQDGGYVLLSGLPRHLRAGSMTSAYANLNGAAGQVVANPQGRIIAPLRNTPTPSEVPQLNFTMTTWRAA
ncbi:hypothetical protein [Nesterenkonia flava]|uniref:Uncharacterized protein n=1 Tax=Nesterenkonia flava TaxID=469799 RepID=A0ABU1FRV3_9MICC|nr:hypothetical protein [Nesterenkonia flava]MDR5711391.1 hypothetical protein [Nesterenkonia flava]